jgi:hypothetical protein
MLPHLSVLAQAAKMDEIVHSNIVTKLRRRNLMKSHRILTAMMVLAGLFIVSIAPTTSAAGPKYDITTLAGKVASVNGTAGLQIRFSAFIEQEAQETGAVKPFSPTPITPIYDSV